MLRNLSVWKCVYICFEFYDTYNFLNLSIIFCPSFIKLLAPSLSGSITFFCALFLFKWAIKQIAYLWLILFFCFIFQPEDFWFSAPKKGIMVFALPGEPGLTELAGDFKIHFHDRQGDFYWYALKLSVKVVLCLEPVDFFFIATHISFVAKVVMLLQRRSIEFDAVFIEILVSSQGCFWLQRFWVRKGKKESFLPFLLFG